MRVATGVANMRTSMESLEIRAPWRGRRYRGIAAQVLVSRAGHPGLSPFAPFEGHWSRV
jgi:hypothetical protein